MKLIRLNGKYAVDGREYTKVDDSIYEELMRHSWYVDKVNTGKYNTTYYVRSRINNKKVSLHRYVMGFPNYKVDHINHNTLDNQKCNLRLATNFQNGYNSRFIINTSSIYKGVSWNKEKSKWESYINYDGKRYKFGYFSNEFDAAIAYNDASLIYHREFGRFNRLPYGIARFIEEMTTLEGEDYENI